MSTGMGPSDASSGASAAPSPARADAIYRQHAVFAEAELLLKAHTFRAEEKYQRMMGCDDVADAYSDCAAQLEGRASELGAGE